MLRKDVEDQSRAVDDLETLFCQWVDAGQLLQVPALSGGQLVVEDHHSRIQSKGRVHDLLRLTSPYVGSGIRPVAPLHESIEHVCAGGVGKRSELVKRPFRLFGRSVTEDC